MVNNETTSANVTASELSLLSQLDELRSAWQETHPKQAKGGLEALSGFDHQFLLTLLKIVRKWKEASEAERQDRNTAHKILAEAISDITEAGKFVTITQVKKTLSGKAIREALAELWEIFNLASELTPELVEHLRFKISGKFEDNRNPNKVIKEWNPTLRQDQAQRLDTFKTCVSYELVSDPRLDLTAELENLSRDEDTETTIGRWLGYYLLQLGSGLSPERISALIWWELINDKSLEAFRATQARLFSRSDYQLGAVRHTLGGSLSLPRTDLLSELRASVITKRITLLIGSSGSGKSALCKLAMQTSFQDYTCLFLHPSDIIAFTETSDSTSSRDTRRIDELLTAQVIEKPIIIIDDLSDVNEQSFDCVLNLLQNALVRETSDVRFVLVAHLDAERRVRDKIAARLGAELSIDVVKLPQLPINDLQSSNTLPGDVASLVQRADEFGPALNLKLLDWLISSVQRDNINNISSFKNDLDLLAWFWRSHVGDSHEASEEGRVLIKTAISLADKFTPDLSLYDSGIESKTLYILVRRDCLRVVEEKVAVTHRFVGDCARFRYLLGKRRELEASELAAKSGNPLWSQPLRWFALYLAMESEETETWQELLQEAKKGNYLQLIDLLLDGAILSKKPSSVLQGCSGEHLPFFIQRLISRLLAIATEPTPDYFGVLRSMSASERLMSHERTIGTPKVYLWEPVWRWLLAQNQEALIENSKLIFKAAKACVNWGIAEIFPLRVQIAELIIDLAHRVLLPDPDQEKWYSLHDSSSAEVNDQFRKFMVSQGGIYLCAVICINPQLGAELLLALTISPPYYRYEFERSSNLLDDNLGTEGYYEIDVCTFKFLPLLYLLEINEPFAVDVIATLCNVATDYWHEHHWAKNQLEGMQKTDTDGITLLVGENRKHFKGGRHALYWHRQSNIVACFLMTLEGWLYSRPTKAALENSISIIFERADTVAMIGVLISLAKCDSTLLKGSLLPLLSSLQLLIWLEFDQIGEGQNWAFDFDSFRAKTKLSQEEYQELLGFHLLSHRKIPLLDIILRMWLKEDIPSNTKSQIWEDWDNNQLNLIPEVSQHRALKIRALFEHNNCLLEEDEYGNQNFRFVDALAEDTEVDAKSEEDEHETQSFPFVGTLPEDTEVDAKSKSMLWNLQHFQIVMMCRKILDGELQKTPELHRDFITLLISEEQLTSLQERLEKKAFLDTAWAMIAVVLEPPSNEMNQDSDNYITHYPSDFSNLPISLDISNRCQNYIGAEAFIAHAAPKLLRRCESETLLRASAFRCLIGVCNCNTSAFMRSWIREYGLDHTLTQEIINVTFWIARLIALTHIISYNQAILEQDTHLVPLITPPEIIDRIIRLSNGEHPEIQEAWSNLQSQFVTKTTPELSIIDAFKWTPELLILCLEIVFPRLKYESCNFNNCFDWNFLTAVLIPILEIQLDNTQIQDFITALCHKVLFTLICQREVVYLYYKNYQRENGSSPVHTRLYQDQYQLLNTVIESNPTEVAARINILIEALKSIGLVDCIVLNDVVHILSHCIVKWSSSNIIDNSFRSHIASTVGEYLFKLKNQEDSNLRFLGKTRDIWEKLIDLLWKWSQNNIEKATQADQWLVNFFSRFHDVLLPDRVLRIKLYRIGKSTDYKQFRRLLFTTLVQNQDHLPSRRNDESKLLVQVLAELWDSDRKWIIDRQARLQDLKTILEQLQEIDAVGARRLADQIADSLV
ncbi:hypothetical protein PCC9214_05722 [Planktothrix tepida]|uniref:AAA+ ATPase domain-containing protein n=1 Tax=Planktothrix tepida PCC 9214 TaxID=671072 RepID=A0A1J1LSN6_9CYAN|nr:ATP-binding protein [Planktothrix tepida]CAD5990123.1 hypothetical protein PCC9214_05722 [Planktothrix tepida]CUR35619.1 hypothetical protein PL9214670245 [Planktothrix tepida PCC 9214]